MVETKTQLSEISPIFILALSHFLGGGVEVGVAYMGLGYSVAGKEPTCLLITSILAGSTEMSVILSYPSV